MARAATTSDLAEGIASDDDEPGSPPRRRGPLNLRRWASRIVAALALLLCAIAVLVAVTSVHSTPKGLTETEAAAVLARLDGVNRPLSAALSALGSGKSPARTREANRAAYVLTNSLLTSVNLRGDFGAGVRAVLDAQHRYTDAIGSAIFHPRSPLVDKVVPYAQALRTAISDAPGGDPQLVGGATSLVSYSHARVAATQGAATTTTTGTTTTTTTTATP